MTATASKTLLACLLILTGSAALPEARADNRPFASRPYATLIQRWVTVSGYVTAIVP